MRPRSRRSIRTSAWVLVGVVASVTRLALPDAVVAAQSWSITASPAAVSDSGTTPVRITVVNTSSSNGGDESIGCVQIVIPATFTVISAALVSTSPGLAWSVTETGLGSTTVTAAAAGGGDRLAGNPDFESVVFDVVVGSSQPGTHNWTANEYNLTDCSGPFAQPVQLTFEVVAGNDPPIGSNDAWTVVHDRDLLIGAPGVLANDSDADGDPLVAVLDSPPSSGSLTLNPDGSFDYRPTAGFVGGDSFVYRADDGTATSTPVTVSLAVTDTTPVAVDDAYSVVKNVVRSVAAPGVLANDTDADGDPLAIAVLAGPTHGTVVLAANGSFDYRPTIGYEGSDSFTYTIDDGARTATATVTLTIANDPPTAVDDAYAALVNLPLTVARAAGVLANDVDPNGESLGASVVSGPSNGSLTLQPDGSFVYAPDLLFTGTDSFTYSASDGGMSAAATVTISVANVGPIALDDSAAVVHDRASTVAAPGVLANDVDPNGDTLSATLLAPPANGAVTLAADGGYVYIPDPGFVGVDAFTYAADDGGLVSAAATVVLTVTNGGPVASPDAQSTPKNVSLSVATPGVLANDVDPDGDALTAALLIGPSTGVLSLAADGSFTFVPTAGWVGSASFTYTVSDGVDSASGTVTIVVANSIPVAEPDAVSVARNGTLSTAAPGVLANDDDENGDSLSATLLGAPLMGSLSFSPDGSFIYVPIAGAVGFDSFTYVISDGSAVSSPATVSIEVINRSPVMVSSSHTVVHDRSLSLSGVAGALAGATDADGDVLTAALISGPAFGSLSFSPDGSFSYAPIPGYVGADAFTFSGSDGVATTRATIDIAVVNTAPTSATDAYAVSAGGTLVVPASGVLANDADADGDGLLALIATLPANGVVTLAPDGGLVYVPAPSFAGTDLFTYRASDVLTQSGATRVTITVKQAPTPTPTPSSTPTRTPTPPELSASVVPTASPSVGSEPSTAPTPGATGGPPPSGPPAPPPDPIMRPAGADVFSVPGGSGSEPIAVNMAAVGFGGLGGLFLWAVPGLVLSVPGLLVMLVVGAQAVGGLAWLPIARRRLGSFGLRRRPDEGPVRR